jgi:hypothetical protein
MLEKSLHDPMQEPDAPQLTIEMSGPNILIRSTTSIDEGYTLALAETVNAAAATHTAVIIDPVPVRCSDSFAAEEHLGAPAPCAHHDSCEPVDVEVVNGRMIRIAAERDSWTIDLRAGRFCQAPRTTHLRHLSPEAWVSVIAIIVTRTRLSALTAEGNLITSTRAHRAH